MFRMFRKDKTDPKIKNDNEIFAKENCDIRFKEYLYYNFQQLNKPESIRKIIEYLIQDDLIAALVSVKNEKKDEMFMKLDPGGYFRTFSQSNNRIYWYAYPYHTQIFNFKSLKMKSFYLSWDINDIVIFYVHNDTIKRIEKKIKSDGSSPSETFMISERLKDNQINTKSKNINFISETKPFKSVSRRKSSYQSKKKNNDNNIEEDKLFDENNKIRDFTPIIKPKIKPKSKGKSKNKKSETIIEDPTTTSDNIKDQLSFTDNIPNEFDESNIKNTFLSEKKIKSNLHIRPNANGYMKESETNPETEYQYENDQKNKYYSVPSMKSKSLNKESNQKTLSRSKSQINVFNSNKSRSLNTVRQSTVYNKNKKLY